MYGIFYFRKEITGLKTIAITNQKGGVAKTTTSWSVGVGLHKKGNKVLLVDLDAQTNLSFTAKVDLLNLEHTLYDCFNGKAKINDCIITIDSGLDIIVGGIDLASADRDFNKLGRERMLKKALEPISNDYDFCIIDTPPTLGVLNENALTVSDSIIIPMQAEIYALQGINQLYGFIEDIREISNPGLQIEGILITRVNENTNLYKDMRTQFENVAERMGTKVFNTFIHSTVAVGEVALQRSNLFDEMPNATATKDYKAFIEELLQD